MSGNGNATRLGNDNDYIIMHNYNPDNSYDRAKYVEGNITVQLFESLETRNYTFVAATDSGFENIVKQQSNCAPTDQIVIARNAISGNDLYIKAVFE